ncbi:hypothetical protein HZS_7975 [Henneguya salminicola]|nr:hypothetical protein HZS_7975 [Henneguya salminicola]
MAIWQIEHEMPPPPHRYTTRINDHFSNIHHNIAAFVQVIRKELDYHHEKCLEVRQNFYRFFLKMWIQNKN